MKKTILGSAYLISGTILILAANIGNDRTLANLGLAFGLIGIILPLTELIRGEYK
jgi:hypothetical protein